jgi:hypothetical protein
MKSIFSRSVLAAAAMAAVALVATSAVAETTLKVPFNFTAGDKVLSAGYYTVTHDDTGSFVTLARKGTSDIVTYVVGPGAADPNDRKVSLKFDTVGDAHVLQSIQYGAVVTSRLDKKSLRDAERDSTRLTGGR